MLTNQQKQSQIENYVQAYNAFDVAGMLQDLHPEVVFKNIANGEVNMELAGVEAFENQANQAKAIFSERQQTITQIDFSEEAVTIQIDYEGVVAQDLPNGLKAGQELKLNGRSVFKFAKGKIIEIQDIS
ncbi:MAG TPA: hypothetical protein DCS93_02745 [Microscillaceae bacterium]|nr:hypothetical protein [Microscillaceae bacterium]